MAPKGEHNRAQMQGFLDATFKRIWTRKPGIKVHGFGCNASWAWLRYPWYSVDATTWVNGGKYGSLVRKRKSHKPLDFGQVGKGKQSPLETKTHHVDNDYHFRRSDAARGWLEYERQVTEAWAQRGVAWSD